MYVRYLHYLHNTIDKSISICYNVTVMTRKTSIRSHHYIDRSPLFPVAGERMRGAGKVALAAFAITGGAYGLGKVVPDGAKESIPPVEIRQEGNSYVNVPRDAIERYSEMIGDGARDSELHDHSSDAIPILALSEGLSDTAVGEQAGPTVPPTSEPGERVEP